LLVQMGADLVAFNDYDLTPVDFADAGMVKELGLGSLKTGINHKIKDKIKSGESAGQKFVIYDKLSEKQKECIRHARNKWLDIFHGMVK
jgi:hypothetical protein